MPLSIEVRATIFPSNNNIIKSEHHKLVNHSEINSKKTHLKITLIVFFSLLARFPLDYSNPAPRERVEVIMTHLKNRGILVKEIIHEEYLELGEQAKDSLELYHWCEVFL